uniref:FCH domain-containing protein n=1 Tax=Castor canadensis TaxID=51338 RepID=A0A8C0ZN75_CASCN
MGFGSDLKNSHEAVLKLQDWELRLLETVKKFMALRIKSDKEYASTLQNLCNQVDKESTVQMNYVSNVSKVRIISSFIMYNIIIVLKANRSYYGMSIPSQLVVLNFF